MADAVESPTQVKRHRRSVSQYSDFVRCSWAFRLKRIHGVLEQPSVWLAGGVAFHEATEDFDRACWPDNDPSGFDPADFHAAFAEHFDAKLDEIRQQHPGVPDSEFRTAGRKSKDKPAGEDIAWWRGEGPVMVDRYIQWRTSTVDSLRLAAVESGPGIEVEVQMPLGGVPFVGYIDRVFEDVHTGGLLVVDLKTGSREPDNKMQLAVYAAQLERILHRPVTWGAYFMARTGALTDPADLSAYTEPLLGTVFRNLDRAVDGAMFLPNLGSHCRGCGVRKACVFQGGTDPA